MTGLGSIFGGIFGAAGGIIAPTRQPDRYVFHVTQDQFRQAALGAMAAQRQRIAALEERRWMYDPPPICSVDARTFPPAPWTRPRAWPIPESIRARDARFLREAWAEVNRIAPE